MSIRIITDSASDIEQGEYPNVDVLPMTITIDEEQFLDGIDISKDEFYRRLETSDVVPVTSLISPFQFQEIFDSIEATGDEAIVITMTSRLSGTYQSAKTAAKGRPRISVIDSLQVTAAQRLLVLRAMQLTLLDLTREEIVEELEKEKRRIVVYAAVDTLDYLLKGGRISKSSALVGGFIGIKPILTLDDGVLVPIGKARGSKKSHAFLNQKIREVGGIDFSMPYAVGYSGTDKCNLQKYLESNQAILDSAPHSPEIVQIGSTVGTHAGPGTVLVTFFRDELNPSAAQSI